MSSVARRKSNRASTKTAKAASSSGPGSSYRKDKIYCLALHVHNSSKRKDSPSIRILDNPYIAQKSFKSRTSLFEILSYITGDLMEDDESFRQRYTGTIFDDITGLMLLKPTTKENPKVPVKTLLNKREKVFIQDTTSDDEHEWKACVKKSLRTVLKGTNNKKVYILDIGFAVYSPDKNPPANKKRAAVTLDKTVTQSKKKKKKIEKLPPDIIRINILQPVHISKRNNALETSSTGTLKSINIDFKTWVTSTPLQDTDSSDESDDDILLDTVDRKEYVKHGMVGPIRNRVANEILNDARCSGAYRGVLGKRVRSYFLYLLQYYLSQSNFCYIHSSRAGYLSWNRDAKLRAKLEAHRH